MRPHVICHMATSIDGRILPDRWQPKMDGLNSAYERIHGELNADAWLIGRVTAQEFAKQKTYQAATRERFPRESWIVRVDAETYAVVLDPNGRIAWGRSDIGGDPIVVIMTEAVPDSYLAGLRRDDVSYFFAGRNETDLTHALEFLFWELGIKRLALEGGGHVNGSFLRAGLVDEISLIIAPCIDGRAGAPCVFDGGEKDGAAPINTMRLTQSETLDGGQVWLRYALSWSG